MNSVSLEGKAWGVHPLPPRAGRVAVAFRLLSDGLTLNCRADGDLAAKLLKYRANGGHIVATGKLTPSREGLLIQVTAIDFIEAPKKPEPEMDKGIPDVDLDAAIDYI